MRKALLWEGPRPILGLLTLNELREAAKAQGLKGYSKMSKDEIKSLLELVVVWKGDTKTVRFLGQAFLRTCEVERWKKVRYGVHRRWSPAAWLVPRFRLAALSPLSEEEVIALQRERPHRVRFSKVVRPRHRVVMDIVPDSGIRRFGNAPRRSCERFASLFRSTWDRLPTKDRKKMLAHCRRIKGRNASTLLFVDYGPSLLRATSAIIFAKKSEICFESRAMQASTDARVRAIIAHELGHLRSHCDLGINQDDQDLAEAEANYYAKLWGHPFVNNLYKTEECDELQKFSRQLGMSWCIFCVEEVLCVDDLCGTFFTCLKPGERFLAKDSDFYDIGEDFEEVRDYMRYCSTRKALIGGQS